MSAHPNRTTPPTPPASPTPRLVVGAGVVDSLTHPTTLLCAARSYPPEHAGRYELPGGKVEPGEHPTQALVRELSEELGLPVTLGPEVTPTPALALAPPPPSPTRPGDDAPAWPILAGYRMRVWLAQPLDGATPHLGRSHLRLDWVALDRIEELDWLAADAPILPRLRAVALGG